MSKLPRPQLDRLRPAEKAIFQKLRPQIGRANVDQIAANLRRSHPQWSEFYNIDADRLVEVLEHAGLGEVVERGPVVESRPATVATATGEAEAPPPPKPAGRRKAQVAAPDEVPPSPALGEQAAAVATPAPRSGAIPAVLTDVGEVPAAAVAAALPPADATSQNTRPVPESPDPVESRTIPRETRSAPARTRPAPSTPQTGPIEQPSLLPAEPVSISALRSGRRGPNAATAALAAIDPTRPTVRRNQVEHVSDPVTPAAEAADLPETTGETQAADRRRGRATSTARALKRAAGSLDELLQQLDAVDTEVGRAHAEIEQVNRRIAELERRRQALGDQLALTLRSRVPAEILRLAAADAVKTVPGEAGSEQAG